jgi:hypothetical protein
MMKITSHTPAELVVEDSSVWLSYILGTCAAVVMFFSVTQHQPRALFGAALFLLFALIADVRTTFTFDSAQRVVRWKGLKQFRTYSGTIPFDDIDDIGTETSSGSDASTYRLTIITPNGAVPMAYSYTGRNDAYAPLREQILHFIKPELQQAAGLTSNGISADLEPSLRSLLEQGRKIDAIKLLQSTQNLGLSDSVKRIDLLEQNIKAKA